MRIATLVSLGFLLAACGSEPCALPDGCVRAARVDGACACAEWAVVSTETVRLPFVVVDVAYAPAGTASALALGTTSDPSATPQAASRHGANVRALIRAADGGERIARVGTVSEWMDAAALSATTLRVGDGGWLETYSSDVDLPDHGSNGITVWTNAQLTVATDAAGETTVHWSWASPCFGPLACIGTEPMIVSAPLLLGDVTGDASHEAFLGALTAADRAALLAFDPRASIGAAEYPRFQVLYSDRPVGATPAVVPVAWTPCLDPEPFVVLAETTAPLSGGETLVLQYGVQHDDACAPQRPGLLLGTATEGCSFHAAVLVDRIYGTLLVEPNSAAPTCTGG